MTKFMNGQNVDDYHQVCVWVIKLTIAPLTPKRRLAKTKIVVLIFVGWQKIRIFHHSLHSTHDQI